MELSAFGVIGLGVMGSSLSLNIADKGFSLSVYNRIAPGEEHMVSDLLDRRTDAMSIQGFSDLEDFIASLQRPRKILIMIKAGKALDHVIDALLPLLLQGDIIIDGGNSHFSDTKQRCENLRKKNVHFIGCGVSGGEEGALKGPSLMVGGNHQAYQSISEVFEAIAGKDKNGLPCCTYVGQDGSGHFVKMVHNGIEYAEMQLLAELYALLRDYYSNVEIAELFKTWNQSDLGGYLLEITIDILTKKEGDDYILDTILDKAGNKGTGSWSSKVALDLGSVNTMMASSVFARYVSSFKSMRVALSKSANRLKIKNEFQIEALEKAYRFARIINHYQGFALITNGSQENSWSVDCSEVARIWTNGCIIRSDFMEASIEYLKDGKTYFEVDDLRNQLRDGEADIKSLLTLGLENNVSVNTFYSAYDYWLSMTSENLSANLIQAQRDYFGAHTYQKNGYPEDQYFHTNWTE
ncbi:MAG: NADP-dependent phosphogluconate dehydrogenase [Winogradskyella sp.]|uniref:NADP-dependent phosphogluconate dehydrogenase n=1 Tax=Winogradskyella sp. TaxID=1883156 RepID=UPI0025D4B4DE|nr:NADP-dependent phosphogluconate dehydrogenase [Winogradskyella sp.]NRB84804.1 NADP-dependent phosphogluconate dehydrogenase [Winogradskyella sp.]